MARPTRFYIEAFLLIAQGGWWKPEDVMAEMPLELRAKDAHTRLWYMVRSGYLQQRTIPPERREKVPRKGPRNAVEYAVTPECFIPQGLTAGAVSQALIGRRA